MISAENLINTKLRKIFLFRYKVSLQKFIEAVFVYTLFYDLRNVGPNPGSPMNYRFFCNSIIYNGKVRIKGDASAVQWSCFCVSLSRRLLNILQLFASFSQNPKLPQWRTVLTTLAICRVMF